MSDVLVTGASGGIGSTVVSTLAASGHRVIAMRRDAEGSKGLNARGFRVVVADLAHVGELRDAISGIDHLDVLIHCAGVSTVDSVADTDTAV